MEQTSKAGSEKSTEEVIGDERPILYFYPTEPMDLVVTLGRPEKLTCTYPAYKDGWKVKAYPNSRLTGSGGREYYALYWEGIDDGKHEHAEGFVVKGEESAVFLEEKLAVLGLTPREAQECIIYWLPELQKNKYTLIHFQEQSEIDANMPLSITPAPETVIRVMIEMTPLEEEIILLPQKLITPKRTGFVVVEWGGVVLNQGKD